MGASLRAAQFAGFLLVVLLAGCASSDVGKYAAAAPEEIAADIDVRPSEASPDLYTFTGPAINVRAGYGAFTKGMLGGGSNFGSSVALHGLQIPDGGVTHRIVVTLQYTNLGGVYRDYDRAGIEGFDVLYVESLDRDKQFSAGGTIMTETIGVEIGDAALRSRNGSNLVLRLGDDSGNLEALEIPANYVSAYLLAVDRQSGAVASP